MSIILWAIATVAAIAYLAGALILTMALASYSAVSSRRVRIRRAAWFIITWPKRLSADRPLIKDLDLWEDA